MNMNNTVLFFWLLFSAGSRMTAQQILVGPYLQNASIHSVIIMWETDYGDESMVDWGMTNTLGNTSAGSADSSFMNNRIHQVKLEPLESSTTYFYRVKTGNAVSGTYSFKTPPPASDHKSFRWIAMSDMQKDQRFPDKFHEIIQDGVIRFFNDKFDGELIDQLAFVLVPGDLVTDGENYMQWRQDFFEPARDLFARVPVYPVPGNHEGNAVFYFRYFNLPENGTDGFEEFWWYKDYGNMRIIGLNSNQDFRIQRQLDWLDTLLNNTCNTDSVDFVVAQLHHPYHSELWTAGNTRFTGEIIERLENFSSDCGKPSVHLYGHTHAYSRGSSRDHKHLMINVASAGGAIDNWGEFRNRDYNEYAVSQDEYGFVLGEVTNHPDPKMVIKRYSRGDQDVTKDNMMTDSITIRLHPSAVSTPTPVFPIREKVIPEFVMLKANAFSSPDLSMPHGQSHWQVSKDNRDFSSLAAESWRNFENRYFEEDTQSGDDLTNESIPGLDQQTLYWWRVRYRDRELNWSDWSVPVSFTTGPFIGSSNLLLNPGAEYDLIHWHSEEGATESLSEGICDDIAPRTGRNFFAVSGDRIQDQTGRCVQTVDISPYTDSIDAGDLTINFGGYLCTPGGKNLTELKLIFTNQEGKITGYSIPISSCNTSWTLFSEWAVVPVHTRKVRFELRGNRNEGENGGSYFDDLFLTFGRIHEYWSLPALGTPEFTVSPNPFSTHAFMTLPEGDYTYIKLQIMNTGGSIIHTPVKYFPNRILIDRGSLSAGMYLFRVIADGDVTGHGKFIVKPR